MKTSFKYIILIAILGLAFHLRFTHGFLRSVDCSITFITPDPYYHLRRIVLTAQNFPHLPTFDYYLSFPTGAYCIWPPLFDFLCASLAYIIGLGNPSVALIEFVAAVYPILFALATIMLTYMIGKEIFNEYVGIIGAAVLSFLPASVMFSNFGFTDHHIAESFSLLLILYFTLRQKDDFKNFAFLGLSIGIALLFWQGSILFAGIIFLYQFFYKSKYKYGFIAYILPILIILPFSLGGQYMGGYFTHRGLSLLHIALLSIAGFLMYLKYLIVDRKKLFLASGLIVLISILLFIPQLKETLNVMTKNVWTETIPGYQSLMSLMEGYIKTTTVNRIYGRFYFLLPIIIILLAFNKTIKKRGLFIYLTTVIGLFNFLVTQYSVWFSPLYALSIGFFLYILYDFLHKRLAGKLKLIIAPIFAIILFAAFQPIFTNYYFTFEDTPKAAEHLAYLWLRDSTETTNYFFEPTKKPEYGVMSFYEHGHFIIYICKKPAVANNFGKDAPNFDIPNKFILSQTEEEANKILSKYNVRYIFCTPNANELMLAARFLGFNLQDYFRTYPSVTKSGEPATIVTLCPKAIKSTYHRLYKFGGCAVYFEGGIYIEPIRHSRLVYISPTDWPITIFEFVEGTKIKGKAKPYSPVLFLIPVNIPNASLIWSDSLVSDKNGDFLFTCPYNSKDLPAMVISDKETTKIHISNENVLNGDTINIGDFND